jgi:hypothetical protein
VNIAVGGLRLVTVLLLGTAVFVAGRIQFGVMRAEAIGMVGLLAVLCLLAHLPVGFTAVAGNSAARLLRAAVVAVVAAETLAIVDVLRVVPPITGDLGPRTGTATGILTVWAILLTAYLIAVVRATARRAAVTPRALASAGLSALAAAAVWFCLTLMQPSIAGSAAPAVVVMACAGVLAAVRARRAADTTEQAPVAGLLAAVFVALPVVAMMEGVLPAMSHWVRNNAPPWAAAGPHVARLVDPVGLLIFGALVAVVTALLVRSTKRDAAQLVEQ